MRRPFTIQEYRAIDLTMLAMMLIVFEYIIIKVSASRWFWDQPYTVSLAGAITSIAYMRWGAWGAIHAALSGFWYCQCSSGTVGQFVTYIAGNLFSLGALPMLRIVGKEKVREDSWLSMLFPLIVILLMQGGRVCVSLLLGAKGAGVLGFFTTDSLSILFTLLIVWIARRQDGIYEDQKHYLLRVHQPDQSEERI